MTQETGGGARLFLHSSLDHAGVCRVGLGSFSLLPISGSFPRRGGPRWASLVTLDPILRAHQRLILPRQDSGRPPLCCAPRDGAHWVPIPAASGGHGVPGDCLTEDHDPGVNARTEVNPAKVSVACPATPPVYLRPLPSWGLVKV